MLNISQTLTNLITSYNVRNFALVDIEWPTSVGGSLYLTDAPYNVTYDTEYTADSGLKTVSPPNITGDIARDLFNISIEDVSGVYREKLLDSSIGITVRVKAGFFDTDGSLINETINIFEGKISRWSYNVKGEEPTVEITVSGPLVKLTQTSARLTTENSQKAIYSSDTCFDHSYDTANEASLRWGPGE
jgi:hypothetical protein